MLPGANFQRAFACAALTAGRALVAPALGWSAIIGAANAAELIAHGAYDWDEATPGFGGMSGLSVSDAGAALWAASDTGTLFFAQVVRGQDGIIKAIQSRWQDRFLDNFGETVDGFTADAEDISLGSDGSVVVAFESYARIAAFNPPDMHPRAESAWDRFRDHWGNAGFETLALTPDGSFLVVVEAAVGKEPGYPTFFGKDGIWQAGPRLPVPDGYQAVGGDFGPDGKFYLLERNVDLLYRFSTRIRRFAYSGGAFGASETLLQTDYGAMDNMEGISLWRDLQGRVNITLISDDNFSRFQDTQVIEYILVE